MANFFRLVLMCKNYFRVKNFWPTWIKFAKTIARMRNLIVNSGEFLLYADFSKSIKCSACLAELSLRYWFCCFLNPFVPTICYIWISDITGRAWYRLVGLNHLLLKRCCGKKYGMESLYGQRKRILFKTFLKGLQEDIPYMWMCRFPEE